MGYGVILTVVAVFGFLYWVFSYDSQPRSATPSAGPEVVPELGSKLKLLLANEHNAKQAIRDARDAENRERWNKEREIVRKFIEVVKVSIIHDIRNGRIPASVVIPFKVLQVMDVTRWQGTYSATNFPRHNCAYSYVLDEFQEWARQNGMSAEMIRKDNEILRYELTVR